MMKTIYKVKMMGISKAIFWLELVIFLIILYIRFIASYLYTTLRYRFTNDHGNFSCTHAQKRVVKKIVHNCKNAVFPRTYMIGPYLE